MSPVPSPPSNRGSGLESVSLNCELERVLVRCHRDELLELAELVGVQHQGVGFALLARNTARAVRRLAGHGILNAAFRRGDGPPYLAVVASLAGRASVQPSEVEAVELELVRRSAASIWDGMPDEARRALWTSLGLAESAWPPGGAEAMQAAEGKLGRRFALEFLKPDLKPESARRTVLWTAILLSPLGCFLRPFFAAWLVLSFIWSLRADRQRLMRVVLRVARLRQVLLRRITIGLVGSPSTGKDAGIKALFGIDSGNISPIAGSTKTVNIQRVPGATALYVVNTPGLGDVVQAVTDEAKQVISHIDVYLYVVNAEGGVQAREQADYRACVATGKPVLALVNKIDLLRPRDQARYLADARGKLGAAEEDFLAVAFDPMPELAPGPIGLDGVHAWLRKALTELGKDAEELPPLPTPPEAAPATS